ncbi:LOW QUALITY PROTEIN: Down syndrome critical region protein 9-like [Hylobates moloch]|uniref:LOW QUALITY PROTEIN: Down syndrome critical region protein 9-like n=1 Tax=Hylobates moloch TaxID=81572 RepID=UPI0013629FC1|nr:LOW QUALITY PROTEIN: Down syndrome critical region protein 9-like [Hylobates moloch]
MGRICPVNSRARRHRARPGRPSGDSLPYHQLQRGAPPQWSPDPGRPAAYRRAHVCGVTAPRWGSASSRQGGGAVLQCMLPRRAPPPWSRAAVLGHDHAYSRRGWGNAALFLNRKRKQEGTENTGICCRPESALACGGNLSPQFFKTIIQIQTQELW